MMPCFVLAVYQSHQHSFSKDIGPFQPVHLIVHTVGMYLQNPAHQFTVIDGGIIDLKSPLLAIKAVVEKWLDTVGP